MQKADLAAGLRTAGFFAPAGIPPGMRTFREALRELPGGVYADVLEGEEGYLVVVDVPGATAETTRVDVEGRRLSVRADRAMPDRDDFEYRRQDRDRRLSFELPLPPDALPGEATANVDRGVLEIELPKSRSGDTTIPLE